MIGTRPLKKGVATLRKKGAVELKRLRELRAKRALVTDDFDRAIYASETVRAKVWRLQHGKCCYCERHYERKWADVEHFRPKTQVIHTNGAPPVEGYWWLAYDIDNLYFACPNCNRPKGINFPLEKPPPLSPEQHPRQTQEWPMLLEPRHDAIECHLTFIKLPNGSLKIAPRNGSTRGAETIRVVGPDRDDLTSFRNKHYKKNLHCIIRRFKAAKDAATRTAVQKEAKPHATDDAEFALLARVVFRGANIPI